MTTPAPPTTTLAVWLEQQVAADEALATAATDGLSAWDCWAAVGSDAIAIRKYEVGAFIAAQDPAQTLRRVAAIRQVLALHTRAIGLDHCVTCVEHDYEDTPWPCPTLRALASMFADRDGYRAEEWA